MGVGDMAEMFRTSSVKPAARISADKNKSVLLLQAKRPGRDRHPKSSAVGLPSVTGRPKPSGRISRAAGGTSRVREVAAARPAALTDVTDATGGSPPGVP